jgi:hypothetical protein
MHFKTSTEAKQCLDGRKACTTSLGISPPLNTHLYRITAEPACFSLAVLKSNANICYTNAKGTIKCAPCNQFPTLLYAFHLTSNQKLIAEVAGYFPPAPMQSTFPLFAHESCSRVHVRCKIKAMGKVQDPASKA